MRDAVTQMALARRGAVTPAMEFVAAREQTDAATVRDEVARGRLVIPANVRHLAGRLEPMAIGKVARVKINADIGLVRQAIIAASTVPIGTVPIYQIVTDVVKDVADLEPRHFLEMIEHQARQGVDYMTLHAGILLEHLPLVYGRVTGIVSRGGSLHAVWMMHHRKQNPLYQHYDDVP